MGGSAHPHEGDHWSHGRFGGPGNHSKFRIETVVETGSTNADLVDRIAAGDFGVLDGLVLRAGHQTAGQGRLDRRWDAPPGVNLLFSVLLHLGWPAKRLSLITSCLAVSLVEVLAPLVGSGQVPAIKWPNDVLLVDRKTGRPAGKLAGILAEMVGGPVGSSPAVVVGMGVNVGWPGPGDEALPGAVSLAGFGLTIEPSDLLVHVLETFEGRISDMDGPDGLARLREAHLARSATVGRTVRAEGLGEDVVGTAVDVGLDGALVVEMADGATVDVLAADVVHLQVD